MLDFLQRADVPFTDRRDGWLDQLVAAGRSDGCVGPNAEINTSPTLGTSVTPPPAPPSESEGDTAQQQGAPSVDPGLRLEDVGTDASGSPPPIGQGGDRPPEEEPRDHPTGSADPIHGRAEPQQRTLDGDPIDLFTGAFVLEETDLTLETAALPLELTRLYRSGRAYFGPFGWGWDHNHNCYLRELADGSVARWTGRLHEDLFVPNGPAFDPPMGVSEVLERLPGPATRYRITAAGGLQWEFEHPAGWPLAERFPLARHRDRHGNEQAYHYDAEGRLVEVRDDDDRFLRLTYGDCGLLEQVADHAGRVIVYEHAPDVEHLVAVRDTGSAMRRAYRYDEPSQPEKFRHNILEVTDGEGKAFVQNEYEQNPADWAWGRVLRQLYGDYLYQVRYQQLQRTPTDPVFANVPSVQVELMDPELSVSTSTFNSRGDLLDYRFRLVRDRSYRVVVHQFEYDANGNRCLVRYPDGMEELRTYRDTDPDPRMRGRLVRREVRARSGFPAPSRIMWRGTYEPVFQLPRSVTDEARNTTVYRYDLDTAKPAATGRLERIELPDATLPDDTVQSSAIEYETNARGQITAVVSDGETRTELRYGTSGDDRALLTEIWHDISGLDLVERFTYNTVGDVVVREDPTGTTREFEYDERRNVVVARSVPLRGLRSAVVLTRDPDGEVISVSRPRGDYDDPKLAGAAILDVVERNVLGHITSSTLAANTARPRHVRLQVDYRGQITTARDATGQRVVQTFDERGTLLSREARGPDGTRLRETHSYDTVGRRTRHHTGPLGDLTVTYDYDAFGRVHHVTSANGSVVTYVWGDDDLLAEESVTGDPGDGVPRLLTRTTYAYDERGRMIRERRDSFRDDPTAAVDVDTTYTYDGDDNRVAVTNARGETTHHVPDALGRSAETLDPAGNRVVHHYEGLDRVVRVEHHDVTPNGTIVRAWTHGFDGRGRRVRATDPLGNAVQLGYDDRDVTVSVTDPNGVVERRQVGPTGELLGLTRDADGQAVQHEWTYDEAARLTCYIDPTRQQTTYTYDGVGRRTRLDRPGFTSIRTFGADGRLSVEQLKSGAEARFTYDAAGRLRTLEGTAAPGMSAVPTADYTYDGLDRLVSATLDGSTTKRSWDSMGRLIAESRDGVRIDAEYDDLAGTVERRWPDGRREQITTGPTGFPTRVDRLAAGTLGDDGTVVAKLTAAGPARVAEQTMQGTVTARADYDTGGRLTRWAYDEPGGPIETFDYRFDPAGRRRVEQAATRDLARLWHFDTLDRVRVAAEGFAPPLAGAPPADQAAQDADIAASDTAASAATTEQAYDYDDGDGRVALRRSGAPATPYTYLPGHRIATAGAEAITYHTDGARAQDATRAYATDALGRIVRVDDTSASTTALKLSYDALGRPILMSTGGSDTRLHYFGDDLLMETENGAPTRQYSTDPRGGPPLAVHLPGQSMIPVVDLSGSCAGFCDVTGQVVETYTYDPFGTPTVLAPDGTARPASAIEMEPVFAGLRWLPDAGLYLSRARLYDPRLGVFISPDPLGQADSPNPYAYARQNPADYVDPEGEFAFLALLGIIAVGALAGGALNLVRQGIAISEGAQSSFSLSELGENAAWGAVLAPAAVFAPEVLIPFVGLGVLSGFDEISRKHFATGLFDIGTSMLGARGILASKSFGAPLSVRVTQAKLTLARTDLNLAEIGLHLRRSLTRKPGARGELTRQIGDTRIARSILDDPTITVRTLDPRTRTVSERPLGFDPNDLGWDGLRRDLYYYRPNGETGGNLDLKFPRFDIEIKLGQKAKDISRKVINRNNDFPERADLPYYLASEIPPQAMGPWRRYGGKVPKDIVGAAENSFDGHLQVTPDMRAGVPNFLRDALSPDVTRYIFPSAGSGKK